MLGTPIKREMTIRAGKIQIGDSVGPIPPKESIIIVERITQKVINGVNHIFCWGRDEMYSFPAKSHITVNRKHRHT